MRLNDIVQTSLVLSTTSSRLRKVESLAQLLRRLPVPERSLGVNYLVGKLPQGRIGLGPALLNELRGIPSVSESSVTLADADRTFAEIATVSGAGATARRRALLGGLFARATADEQRFLARLILGELRQGAAEGLLAEALAKASDQPVAHVRRAIMVGGDLGAVADAALGEGAAGLARFSLTLLQPVQPMLAQTAEDAESAIAQLGRAALEYKLDGARVQLHKDGEQVRVFTRQLHDVTHAVPELVEAARAWPARRLILDGEAIALRENGRPQPFQITMRRFGRKKNADALREELPLQAWFFDCLHAEGEDCIDRPAEARFQTLQALLPQRALIPRRIAETGEQAHDFYSESLAAGHEGIMAKALQAPYEAGNRGSGWLKIKQVHTLDLVVLAAEWGSGRRKGWLSNLHLGARDPGNNTFIMLGKTFKGLTDQILDWQTKELLAREIGREDFIVHVRPELVVEIAFNDIQASPQYPGGLALRFARVKRYRDDKTAGDADTIDMVRELYQLQQGD